MAKARADKLRLTFSAYVQRLVEKDVSSGGPMVIMESAPVPQLPPERPTDYKARGKIREARKGRKSS